jgi:hypothetical protein
VTEHYDGLALLRCVNPHIGLQADDFTALAEWAASHS